MKHRCLPACVRALVRVRALMGLICIRGYFRRSTLEHLSLASRTNGHELQLGFAGEFMDSTIRFMYLFIYHDEFSLSGETLLNVYLHY